VLDFDLYVLAFSISIELVHDFVVLVKYRVGERVQDPIWFVLRRSRREFCEFRVLALLFFPGNSSHGSLETVQRGNARISTIY